MTDSTRDELVLAIAEAVRSIFWSVENGRFYNYDNTVMPGKEVSAKAFASLHEAIKKAHQDKETNAT